MVASRADSIMLKLNERQKAIAFRFHQRLLLTKLQLGPTDHMWWNLTKNISGLSKTRSRSAPDVDSLASYFASKLSLSPDFDSSLSTVPQESDVTYKKSRRVKLSKVCSVLRSLDVKKAIGPDGVSPYILKYCCDELCHPVCLLFHHVCRSGEFPLSWKVSRITPVYKRKGSVTDPHIGHGVQACHLLTNISTYIILYSTCPVRVY